MKTLLSILLVLSAFLISCGTTKPIEEISNDPIIDETEDINIIGGEVTIKLYSKDKSDTVESSLNYMFYDDVKLPYQDSINRIVKEYVEGTISFGGGRTEQDSKLSVEYMEEAMDKYKKEYDRQLEFYDNDDYFGSVWTTETNLTIIDDNPDYAQLSFGNWSYEGGAHGNAESEERIIDRKTGKELMLADFITDMTELNEIAQVIFRGDQEIPAEVTLNEAGFWFEDNIFALNENFVFNPESLDFLYNQYEIAPYAAGMIYLSIPLEKINHLLKRKVN